MSTNELENMKNVFSKNLRRYLELADKSQLDLANYMGVSTASASDWCNSKKMPRMDKIQSIANWLGIQKSDLLDNTDQNNGQQSYYIDSAAADRIQAMQANPQLATVFDATRKVKPQDLEQVLKLIKTFTEDDS